MEANMKKVAISFVAATVLMASGAAWAKSDTNTGCGLGSLAFGNNQFFKTTSLGQSFMVTTNGTFYSSTFGITSGTSNCQTPSTFVKNERMNEFVAANMDNLAKDIAMGHGESLATLAELMEVPSASRPQLYAKLQTNFSNIYTSDAIDAAGVVDNIHSVIQ